MFARNVLSKIKPNSAEEYTRLIRNEIVPLLRKHQGWREEVIFVAPERSEALAISFWDTKEDAEAYQRTGFPEAFRRTVRRDPERVGRDASRIAERRLPIQRDR